MDANFSAFNPLPTARLRDQLSSISSQDFQPNLWQEGTPLCVPQNSDDNSFSVDCSQGVTTFENVSQLVNPYVAQLPSGYHTGLITQFMPRMNSSVVYDFVLPADFPSNCDTIPGAYYVEHTYNTTIFDLRVCMPNNNSQSDWKATRDQQDISEEMFMSVTYSTSTNAQMLGEPPENATLKLVVNTTLGYFELPNCNNSNVAGMLLANDPYETCGRKDPTCVLQVDRKRSLQTDQGESTLRVGSGFTAGPLAMIASALFDNGSFLTAQFPQVATPIPPHSVGYLDDSCTVAPLSLLYGGSVELSCIQFPYTSNIGLESVSMWLSNFYQKNITQNAFLAAVIIASQTWLTTSSSSQDGSLKVMYDMGRDSERPKVSSTGIVLISILLAVDLAPLQYMSASCTRGLYNSILRR